MLRVHRIPHSTNVERVALAAALKRLEVVWVDHDAADRSGLVALSGQRLAPVAELPDGRVVSDSPAILRELDALAPDPPLWPREPAARAQAEVFLEWFNEVWKGPPNRIADGAGSPADAARLRAWCARFEDLLADGRPYLLGPALTVADVVAAPFAAYFGAPLPLGDDDPFHRVLAALPHGERTASWVARVRGAAAQASAAARS
jgi:glutathione S-transferase